MTPPRPWPSRRPVPGPGHIAGLLDTELPACWIQNCSSRGVAEPRYARHADSHRQQSRSGTRMPHDVVHQFVDPKLAAMLRVPHQPPQLAGGAYQPTRPSGHTIIAGQATSQRDDRRPLSIAPTASARSRQTRSWRVSIYGVPLQRSPSYRGARPDSASLPLVSRHTGPVPPERLGHTKPPNHGSFSRSITARARVRNLQKDFRELGSSAVVQLTRWSHHIDKAPWTHADPKTGSPCLPGYRPCQTMFGYSRWPSVGGHAARRTRRSRVPADRTKTPGCFLPWITGRTQRSPRGTTQLCGEAPRPRFTPTRCAFCNRKGGVRPPGQTPGTPFR